MRDDDRENGYCYNNLTYNESRFDMALQEIERIIASNGVSPRQRFEDIHSTLHRYEWPPSALRLRDNQ